MSEWKPIETLPEKQVALLFERDVGITAGSFELIRGKPFWEPHLVGGWEFDFDIANPTHWMDLPKEPT